MNNRIRQAFDSVRADDALIQKTQAYVCRETQKKRAKSIGIPKLKLAGVLTCAALLIIGVLTYNLYFVADAYISLDINPSVELCINRLGRVISTYAYNEEGRKILERVDLQGKKYEEAAGWLLTAIEDGGYFTEGALVTVTVQANDQSKEAMLCDVLYIYMNGQPQPFPREVEVFPVSAETWEHAHECNVSPAKYLAISELMEVDGEATFDLYSSHSIQQIRNRTQECRNGHDSPSNGSGNGAHHNATDSSQSNGNGCGYRSGGGHSGH